MSACSERLARIIHHWGVLICLSVPFFGTPLQAAFNDDLAKAVAPTNDGIPEVAVVRLRALLKTTTTPEEQRVVNENLVQALVAANQPAEALALIGDNKLVTSSGQKFWYAQALAAAHRHSEAL